MLQRLYKAGGRSQALKRTQKGSEGELTECSRSAVNGMSPEILFLSDTAQGLCMLEGNTSRRANGKLREESRGRTPARATHHVIKATNETQRFLAGT